MRAKLGDGEGLDRVLGKAEIGEGLDEIALPGLPVELVRRAGAGHVVHVRSAR